MSASISSSTQATNYTLEEAREKMVFPFINGPYTPCAEGYKDTLTQSPSLGTVVVLGPGYRGLNPFYAFPELKKAIVIDISVEMIRSESEISEELSKLYKERPDILTVIKAINQIAIPKIQSAQTETIDNIIVNKFKFTLPYKNNMERELIFINGDYTEPKITELAVKQAGDNPVRVLIETLGTPDLTGQALKNLVKQVKINKGLVINEKIRNGDQGYGIYSFTMDRQSLIYSSKALDYFYGVFDPDMQKTASGPTSSIKSFDFDLKLNQALKKDDSSHEAKPEMNPVYIADFQEHD